MINRMFELVIDMLTDMAVILIDSNYRYLICRGPLHERLGYSKERMENKTLYEALPDEMTWELLEPLYERVLAGESFSVEFEGHAHPGTIFSTAFQYVEIDSKPHGLIIVRDVTAEKSYVDRKVKEKVTALSYAMINDISQPILETIETLQAMNCKHGLSCRLNNSLKAIVEHRKAI